MKKRTYLLSGLSSFIVTVILVLTLILPAIDPRFTILDIYEKKTEPQPLSGITTVTIDGIEDKNIGDSFDINISCSPDQPMRAWEFSLGFDNTILEADSVTVGDIFDGYSEMFNDGTINNADGTIINMYNLIIGAGNVTSNGTLVTISFTAIGYGTSPLLFLTNYTGSNDPGITNETDYIPSLWVNNSINIDDPYNFHSTDDLGYEFLDNHTVIHAWNTHDDYYFNSTNGVQFTNHYQEYWSHNVLMLGYYSSGTWNLLYRTDELSGFNRVFNGSTNQYLNLTLWKDLSYAGYDFRLALRYYLGVNDSWLTITPYIRNLGIAIPYTLAFGWEIKDIKIANTYEHDIIRINGTTTYLNQTIDTKYINLTNPIFHLENINPLTNNTDKYLYLQWDKTLTDLVWVKSRVGQYNAPVGLFIRVGTLSVGQSKQTDLKWFDTLTLYERYISYDGNYSLYGTTWKAQTFTIGNTGTNENHNITSVRLRMYKVGSPGTLTVYITTLDGSNKPDTTNILATGTTNANDFTTEAINGERYAISLSPTYMLSASTKYAIVCKASTGDGSNYVVWKVDTTSPSYTGGSIANSSDGGSTWTLNTGMDFFFDEFGEPVIMTYVDDISPYWQDDITTLDVDATGDCSIDNVTLWYRWSTGNSTWGRYGWVNDSVDSNSCDVDSSADKGTETNFANCQATSPDTNVMTIQEALNKPTTVRNDAVDWNGANKDAVADVGTESNFANCQATTRDGNYMNITEADIDAGTGAFGNSYVSGSSYITYNANVMAGGVFSSISVGGEITSVSFYGRSNGIGSINMKAVICDSSGNILGNGVSSSASVSTTAGIKTFSYSAGSRPFVDGGSTYWIMFIGDGQWRFYYYASTGGVNRTDGSNSYASPTSPTDAGSPGTYNWRRCYAELNKIDYELDMEYQFNNTYYSADNEQICIWVPGVASEALTLQYWNGASWSTLGTFGTSPYWSNFTATGLTSSTYNIRLKDSSSNYETTQTSWFIDCMFLKTWNDTNYVIDFEYQWTTAKYDRAVELVCFYVTARTGTENLNINYWDGDSWEVLGSIVGTGWRNVTATGLTSSTYTIQLKGTSETGDTSQGDWSIDCIFLREYNNTGNPYSCNWTEWDDATNPDTSCPWTWTFDFPNGTGYYEFYSIGRNSGDTESAPSSADAICHVNVSEESWQVINSSINGTIYNMTVWSVVNNTINGSLYNLSVWQDVNTSINGSIYNLTFWYDVNTSINGSIYNGSIWHDVNTTINGTLYNLTYWQDVNTTINGTLYNITNWYEINNTINGSVYNRSVWLDVNTSINGTIYNLSIWHDVNTTINGTIWNDTAPLLYFVSQDPADLTSFNAIGTPLNATYNITDPDYTPVDNSTVFIHFITNRSGQPSFFVNGTAYNLYRSKAYSSVYGTNYSFLLMDNTIYPATYNYNELILENTPHTQSNLTTNNQYLAIQLFNVSNTCNYSFFEIMANNSIGAISPGIRVYYANESYDFNSPVTTNPNVEFVGTIPSGIPYNHTHTIYSSHMVVPFAINITTGKIGDVTVTPISYFIIRGRPGSAKTQYWSISNVSRTDAMRYSANNGLAWTNQTFTVDAHLHQYNGSDLLCYYASANDTDGNYNQSDSRCDLIDLAGMVPTVIVYTPTEGNYSGLLNITYHAESPNSYPIINFSISLLDEYGTWVYLINESGTKEYFVWNTTEVEDGTYIIRVYAYDSLNQKGIGYSEVFNITNAIWRIVNNSINGTIYNLSVWQDVNITINGSLYNLTFWYDVNTTMNGTIYNLTFWYDVNTTINGTIYNLTAWHNVNTTINGTIYNESTWTIVYTLNGTIYNATTFVIINNTINGTIYNRTAVWYEINTSINGTIYNLTVGVIITNETPANNSLSLPSYISVCITVNDTFGLTINITWWGSTNNGTTWFYLGNTTNATNGTYCMPFSNRSILGLGYWWRLNASDSLGYYANETYIVLENQWWIQVLKGGNGMLYTYILMVLSASPFILLFIRRRRRRKRNLYR